MTQLYQTWAYTQRRQYPAIQAPTDTDSSMFITVLLIIAQA